MLNKKKAIVTGSTSGIGLGIARKLAAAGCDILLNGFCDPKEVDLLISELSQKHGVVVKYSAADMSKPDQISSMIRQAESELGGLDILINNAGIQYTAPVENFPDDKWDAIIAINLSAAFHTIKNALPEMKARGYGRIINIASVHGLIASVHKAAYVAAKHGLIGLTQVTALENAELNITCNAICPGWVHTPLVQKQIEDNAKAAGITVQEATKRLLEEKEPSLRFATPEDIGDTVLFLLSNAGRSITGSAITIDGGWTAR